MDTLREWFVRLWSTLRPGRPDDDMEEELRAHVALAAESGRPETHAGRHVTQTMDTLRDQRGLPWLDHFVQDGRYGLRGLRRSPLFTAVAILSLALGIGANTALFSLVDDLLLRSLPVRDPDRVVQVRQMIVAGGGAFKKPAPSFPREVFDQIAAAGSFSEIVGVRTLDRPSVAIDGTFESVARIDEVSTDFFRDLGVPLTLGRAPRASDGDFAIISEALWRRRFGRDPAVLGRTVIVRERPYTVLGVAPRRFPGMSIDSPSDIWIPADGTAPLLMFARLQPGMTPAQATAALQGYFQRRAQETGDFPPDDVRAELVPAGKGLSQLRDQYERPLQALTILVTLVLLLTCSNVGSLLMVRNAGRQRELTVRVALGAGRGRLLMQYLVESLLLAAISGALALAVARWGVSIALSMLPLPSPPDTLRFAADARVIWFVVAISLASAILFGLAPAWRASRVELTSELRASQGGTASRRSRGLGRWLVATQVGLSVLLLVGAGLFVQTLRNLRHIDVGFDPAPVLQVSIDTRGAGYREGQVGALMRLLLERLSAIPGVRSATFIRNPVMRHSVSRSSNQIRGSDRVDVWDSASVGPAFFETMGIPVKRGRAFEAADFEREPSACVANEAFVRQFFPREDPIGQGCFVGVVGDVKIAGVRVPSGPMVFEKARKEPDRISALEVRAAGVPPESLVPAIRDAIRTVNPRLLDGVSTMQEEIDRDIARERMVAATSAFFSLLALLLASIGIFGVASYSVAQRTNELGIRMALGAGPARVIVESLRDTMQVFAAGLGAGVIAAFIAVRVTASAMSDLLFGLTPTDTATIAGAGLAMIAVAIAACVIPARHATTIDPLAAIRHE